MILSMTMNQRRKKPTGTKTKFNDFEKEKVDLANKIELCQSNPQCLIGAFC